MNRNSLTEQQATDRMKSQMPLKLKCDKADVVIDNSGNYEQLTKEIQNKFKLIQDMLSTQSDS